MYFRETGQFKSKYKEELAAFPIFEDKIIDFILELADVNKKEVSVEELYKEDNFDLKKEAQKAQKIKNKTKNNKSKKEIKKDN